MFDPESHPGRVPRPAAATPLAANRYDRRPGAGRHPQTGQFTRGEGVAAGYRTLDQQPHGGGVFPQAGSGPFAAQTDDPMTRPVRGPRAGSALEYELNRHAASVGARRLDLAGPAGLPGGLGRAPGPSPVSQRQAGLSDMEKPTAQAVPASIPYPPGSPQWGGPAPLASAISAHSSGLAFGMTPGDVSLSGPGW